VTDYGPQVLVPGQDQLGSDNPIGEVGANMNSCIIQEILSKTVDPDAPLQGQEFYDLRLFEEPNQLGTRHVRTDNDKRGYASVIKAAASVPIAPHNWHTGYPGSQVLSGSGRDVIDRACQGRDLMCVH
jgi:hypothetical protein